MRHLAVLAVAGHEVCHVVADHATEPAALVALVGEVIADVCRGGDADLDAFRVATGFYGRVVDVFHGPIQDQGVSELQDETIGLAPYETQGPGAVAGHPHVELSFADPEDTDLDAGVVDLASLGQLLYDVHSLFELPERRRLAAEDPHHGISASYPTDRAVAEHVVEGSEGRGRHRRVAADRVGDEGADHDPLRRGEHLRMYHVGLLPEDVRVEGPSVPEAEVLGPPGKFDDPARGWVRLQRDAEVHTILLIFTRNCGDSAQGYQDAARDEALSPPEGRALLLALQPAARRTREQGVEAVGAQGEGDECGAEQQDLGPRRAARRVHELGQKCEEEQRRLRVECVDDYTLPEHARETLGLDGAVYRLVAAKYPPQAEPDEVGRAQPFNDREGHG